VETDLRKLGFKLEPVLWLPGAFILTNQSQDRLQETDIYKKGIIYIQSLSSMIPPLVLKPQEGERILDITAAPGSKTTQIAAMMGNSGEIIANDNSRIRLYRLEANLKLMGVSNTHIQFSHGQTVWEKYPEYFDKVLVDVPCSMEGRFFCNDPKSYRHWLPGKVKELKDRQKYLLRSAVSAAKIEGEVIYSTCTLSPEENEEVIDWLLKKHPGALEIAEINLPKLETHQGLTSWKSKDLNKKLYKTIRIYPSAVMEGFFVAKLHKLKSTLD